MNEKQEKASNTNLGFTQTEYSSVFMKWVHLKIKLFSAFRMQLVSNFREVFCNRTRTVGSVDRTKINIFGLNSHLITPHI